MACRGMPHGTEWLACALVTLAGRSPPWSWWPMSLPFSPDVSLRLRSNFGPLGDSQSKTAYSLEMVSWIVVLLSAVIMTTAAVRSDFLYDSIDMPL